MQVQTESIAIKMTPVQQFSVLTSTTKIRIFVSQVTYANIRRRPTHQRGGTHILVARSPGRLNFVRWCLIFVDFPYGTCCWSPRRRLQFCSGFYFFVRFMQPARDCILFNFTFLMKTPYNNKCRYNDTDQ
jgi:hypothetical protein